MVKEIIQLGDPRLFEKSKVIDKNDILSKEIEDLSKDLMDTCKHYIKYAAGLSAVQLGILKRICVVRRIDKEENGQKEPEWLIMINPEHIVIDDEPSLEWEGCMSINSENTRLFGPVERPSIIDVKYTDIEGKTNEIRAEGFFSHLIQHEIDHLNGVLFLKYIDNPENIWKENELDKYLSKNKKFPPIE